MRGEGANYAVHRVSRLKFSCLGCVHGCHVSFLGGNLKEAMGNAADGVFSVGYKNNSFSQVCHYSRDIGSLLILNRYMNRS